MKIRHVLLNKISEAFFKNLRQHKCSYLIFAFFFIKSRPLNINEIKNKETNRIVLSLSLITSTIVKIPTIKRRKAIINMGVEILLSLLFIGKPPKIKY